MRTGVDPPRFLKQLRTYVSNIAVRSDNLDGRAMIANVDVRVTQSVHDLLVQTLSVFVRRQVGLERSGSYALVLSDLLDQGLSFRF